VRVLSEALKSRFSERRIQAIKLLTFKGTYTARGELADAIPALTDALDHDEEPYVRGMAAVALGELGPAARAAIPALRRARTDDPSEAVRTDADRALHRIAP
jgi:HEAT repeat protein